MNSLVFVCVAGLAVLVCIGALELAWALMRAPDGYQDREGFHFASSPEPRREGFTQTPWTPGLQA